MQPHGCAMRPRAIWIGGRAPVTLHPVSRVSGGKYRIIAHLRGGESAEASLVSVETAAAKSAEGGALAVMKRLKLGADAEPQLLERFADEARLCKRFDHPNLAKLFEAGMDEDGPVLVFEYLDGPTLSRIRSRAVRRGNGVPLALAIYIVKQIATALEYAHALVDEAKKPLKVVLRDVSPENVTVTYDGQVKLTEFGMATTAASTKSRENRVKGNVAYMAPEQARAEFSLDSRADIFALGVIFWELLAGRRLWDGLSEVDVLAKLADDTPLPAVKTVAPAVPEWVDAVCSQALAKVRDERFDTATELVEALDKAATSAEMQATNKDLAAFVSQLFADERAKMKSVIDEARQAVSSAADAGKVPLPAIGTPRAPEVSPFVDIESDPKLRFGVVPADEAPAKRVVEVIRVEPSPDRRFAYLMAALVVLVVGVVAVVALTSPKEAKVEAKPYVAPTRPSSTTSAPAGSAFAEPQEVAIEIRVVPLEAKLFVDGVKTSNPYRTKVVPAGFRHQIRAEMEGFETRTMTVAFDKERALELALVPEKPEKKPPVIRKPPPPPPPPPAPAPSAPLIPQPVQGAP